MSEQLDYKVLQLPSFYLPLGGEFCRDQAMLLKRNGINIDILAVNFLPWRLYKFSAFKHSKKYFFSEEDNLTVLRKFIYRIPFSDKPNMKKWIAATMKAFEYYTQQKGMPDIIHVHSCMWAGYAAYLIKQKYGIPYVITEHNGRFGLKSAYSKKYFKEWHLEFLIKAYSNANYILPVSQQLIKRIKELSLESVPILVLSNLTDTSFFHINNRKNSSEQFCFFTANSNNEAKAYDILLKAFDIASKQNPSIHLRIAGNGFQHAAFQKLLNTIQYKNQIHFCGFLSPEKIREELWKADAFVLASRAESQSIAVLEALSTGLPVVATEVVPEEVLIPEAGYRVEVDNPEMLAEGMLKMAKNSLSFNSQQISKHIQNITNPTNFITQTKKIYATLLKK